MHYYNRKENSINDADNLASATISVTGGGFKISATDGDYGTTDVSINEPLGKDFYIKLDSSGAVGSTNSTSRFREQNPQLVQVMLDVTINCTANITESATLGGADNCNGCTDDTFAHFAELSNTGVDSVTDTNAGIGIKGGGEIGNIMFQSQLVHNASLSFTLVAMEGTTLIGSIGMTANANIVNPTVVFKATDGSCWTGDLPSAGGTVMLTKLPILILEVEQTIATDAQMTHSHISQNLVILE